MNRPIHSFKANRTPGHSRVHPQGWNGTVACPLGSLVTTRGENHPLNCMQTHTCARRTIHWVANGTAHNQLMIIMIMIISNRSTMNMFFLPVEKHLTEALFPFLAKSTSGCPAAKCFPDR